MPSFSLPHARGGVSASVLYRTSYDTSSPRSWGCFQPLQVRLGLAEVFPTLVGVFLPVEKGSKRWKSLPHARGGVSYILYFNHL